MNTRSRKRIFRIVASFWAFAAILSSHHTSLADDRLIILGQGEVVPFAVVEFLDAPLLSMAVPPAGSPESSNSVHFQAIGNTVVGVTAEPDSFISIPGVGTIGKAVHDGHDIGYNIRVNFPLGGQGLPQNSRLLPGNGQGTDSLYADLLLSGGSLNGTVDLIASHHWTPDGSLPLAGTYTGKVSLTVSIY